MTDQDHPIVSAITASLESSGYTGASTLKKSLRNWFPVNNSADAEGVASLSTLRDRSADAYRNIPLATSAVDTATLLSIGNGLTYNSVIDYEYLGLSKEQAKKWQKDAEREFALATDTKDFDAARNLCFGEIQGMSFVNTLISGDIFTLLPSIKRRDNPYAISCQLIEGHRVCNPTTTLTTDKIASGIKVNDYGEHLSCFIRSSHPGSIGFDNPIWKEVAFYGKRSGRRQVIQLFDQKRPGQRRGIPYLAPVLEKLKQLGRYTDAELIAAIISGMFTVFIKTESGGLGEPPNMPYLNDGKEPSGRTVDRSDYALGNGAIIEGEQGDSIDSINPGRPNSEFDPFTTSVTREIGAALGQPMELLVKHFKSSYTASRAAFVMGWHFYRNRRTWLARNLCRPILEEVLTEAVLMGRLSAPGFLQDPAIRRAYCRSQWVGPAQGQINELVEVKAAKEREKNGYSTAAQETQAMNGGDWEENNNVRISEEEQRKPLATLVRENGEKNYAPVNQQEKT